MVGESRQYVAGSKGAMSEAQLHVLRARLNGGIQNKAARGELRRGLPIGFVWGEEDGEILIRPDEAVVHVIRTIFARFGELGSARRVWLWLRAHGMKFPLWLGGQHELRWGEASYHVIAVEGPCRRSARRRRHRSKVRHSLYQCAAWKQT